MNRKSYLNNLLHCFVRWACIAAGSGGPTAVQEVLGFMRSLPEGADDLRAAIVGCFNSLMVSLDTISLCLPDFYSALVGPQQIVRSSAATALGEMRGTIRDNLPSLVFEAFTAHLTDPYVIVHRAAGRALERFSLPESLDRTASIALANLINVYARDRKRLMNFLCICIDLYARRYVKRENLAGRLGSALIEVMLTLRPYAVSREARFFGKTFGKNPDYPKLLLRLMADDQVMSYQSEDLFEQLKRLPTKSVKAYRKEIVDLAANLETGRGLHQLGAVIEVLSRSESWFEAATVTSAVYEEIEDNIRNRPLRLHAKLRMLACGLENSLSEGKLEEVDKFAEEWASTSLEIQNDHEINKRRRDPLRGILDKD